MTNRNFEQEWIEAGYPKGMGSAKFLPPPNRDFIRVYHLTPTVHGISSISLRRLKVTRFSDANDPFELMALNTNEREIGRLVRGFKRSQNRALGLLCFCQNWTHPLLWSHYAGKHEGICLGFDVKRGKDVQEVCYEEKRLRMVKGKLSIPENMKEKLLRTKYGGWQYEKELRRFVDLSKTKREHGLYFQPFDEDLRLKEVILGVRNNHSLETIRTLTAATNPEAFVFKVRLERRSFRIVGDGRYRPAVPIKSA